MEDIIKHALVPLLDSRSFLASCLVNRWAWLHRGSTSVQHDVANRYEHLLYGKIPRHICYMPRRSPFNGKRAWLLRDADTVHSITYTGIITVYGTQGVPVVERQMVARGNVERVEALHGVVVIVSTRGVSAYCRHSGYCCELHRLADAKPEDVRSVAIVTDTVFTVVLRRHIVTFIWSEHLQRFVWHSHPNAAYMCMPVACGAFGCHVSLAHGSLHAFCLTTDSEVLPIHREELTLRGAHYLGTTSDRSHLFVIRTQAHYTDIAVHSLHDMKLVDEVTIAIGGSYSIDGHVFTIVDRAQTNSSARYDYRTKRTAYFAGEPDYDACVMDEDLSATFTLEHGLMIH